MVYVEANFGLRCIGVVGEFVIIVCRLRGDSCSGFGFGREGFSFVGCVRRFCAFCFLLGGEFFSKCFCFIDFLFVFKIKIKLKVIDFSKNWDIK